MKILLWNIGYGAGIQGSFLSYLKAWKYLRISKAPLLKIKEEIQNQNPDIVGLLECDPGYLSFFSDFPYRFSECKYKKGSWACRFPFLQENHNAVLSKKVGTAIFHDLGTGIKRLVIEFQVEGISIFLVHLSLLSKTVRLAQLRAITALLKQCKNRYLVAGDFNCKNLLELEPFLIENKLSAKRVDPTFPSIKPKKTLDLILSGPGIEIEKIEILDSKLSDHLPITAIIK